MVWIGIAAFFLVLFVPAILAGKRSIIKVQDCEPVDGLFNLNEPIKAETKLNRASIQISEKCLIIKGESTQFEINYQDIKEVIFHSFYSPVLKAAVVEIKYESNYLLIAAMRFALFNNFVVTDRMATTEIFKQLEKRCKNTK